MFKKIKKLPLVDNDQLVGLVTEIELLRTEQIIRVIFILQDKDS